MQEYMPELMGEGAVAGGHPDDRAVVVLVEIAYPLSGVPEMDPGAEIQEAVIAVLVVPAVVEVQRDEIIEFDVFK